MATTKSRKKKIVAYILASLMAFSIMLPMPMTAYAYTSSDFMKVSGYKSFKKDGKLWMSFNLENTNAVWSTDVEFSAKVVNSAGKTMFTWKPSKAKSNGGSRRDFAADYSKLPAGKYTFILHGQTTRDATKAWDWKYTINHNGPLKFAFKSCEKIRIDGQELHKFTLSQNGGKGNTMIFRIFDSKGGLITSMSKKLSSNEGTVWFNWDGNCDIGGGYRCKSGKYTVQVYFSDDPTVIEKEYDLKIH